jgi:hypothetical protein
MRTGLRKGKLVLASSLERAEQAMTVEESEALLAFIRRTLTWTLFLALS